MLLATPVPPAGAASTNDLKSATTFDSASRLLDAQSSTDLSSPAPKAAAGKIKITHFSSPSTESRANMSYALSPVPQPTRTAKPSAHPNGPAGEGPNSRASQKKRRQGNLPSLGEARHLPCGGTDTAQETGNQDRSNGEDLAPSADGDDPDAAFGGYKVEKIMRTRHNSETGAQVSLNLVLPSK